MTVVNEDIGTAGGHFPGASGPLRFSDDYLMTPTQAGTQWDALAHIAYDDCLYNGFPVAAVNSSGADRCGIDNVARRGGSLAEASCSTWPAISTSATLILRRSFTATTSIVWPPTREWRSETVTSSWYGRMARRHRPLRLGGEWAAGAPGLSWKCAEWFHDHSISAAASDNLAVEVRRMELENVALPLHLLAIRGMGMHLGELWHFEALATDCQKDRVFEVLLIAPPLPITGGVGSPLNPLAIK